MTNKNIFNLYIRFSAFFVRLLPKIEFERILKSLGLFLEFSWSQKPFCHCIWCTLPYEFSEFIMQAQFHNKRSLFIHFLEKIQIKIEVALLFQLRAALNQR